MIISKVENFKKIFLVLTLFALTLVPWIDFVNANSDELDFIFNNNFIILLIIYFFIILFIYLILIFFSPLAGYSLVSFISISVWILFQHNFLKFNINIFLNIINIPIKYSSEIALIFIIISIYLFYVFIKKKIIISKFFIIFLSLNFIFSAVQLTTEFYSKKKVEVKKSESKVSNFKKKKKIKKNISSGIAYVNSTFNNTIISIADESGNVISWSSAGAKGFKGSRKSTPYAAQVAADDAGAKAFEQGLRTLTVQVKGPGSGRETALRSLQSRGFKILSIKDTTPMPHNGARPPKRRRV